jgi:hypothetical protein
VFLGIDVTKDDLVVAVRPVARRWTVPNDEVNARKVTAILAGQQQPNCVPRCLARAKRDGRRSADCAEAEAGLCGPVVISACNGRFRESAEYT